MNAKALYKICIRKKKYNQNLNSKFHNLEVFNFLSLNCFRTMKRTLDLIILWKKASKLQSMVIKNYKL